MVEWQPSLKVCLEGFNSSSTIRRYKGGDTTFLSAKDLFLAASGGPKCAASLWGAEPRWEDTAMTVH